MSCQLIILNIVLICSKSKRNNSLKEPNKDIRLQLDQHCCIILNKIQKVIIVIINHPIMMKGRNNGNIVPKIPRMNTILTTTLPNLIINPLHKFGQNLLKQPLILIPDQTIRKQTLHNTLYWQMNNLG
jgi:hypothetical protein